MWHVTSNMGHKTQDTWHKTYDIWHGTGYRWRRWTFTKSVSSLPFTFWELEVTCDTWHVTHHLTPKTWDLTPDIWHVSGDTQGMINIVSKGQVSSSQSLGVKLFFKDSGQKDESSNQLNNQVLGLVNMVTLGKEKLHY